MRPFRSTTRYVLLLLTPEGFLIVSFVTLIIQKIKDQPVFVAQAEDREPIDRSSSFRGHGRGGPRGGRGGVFGRGIAAAGLMRGQSDKRDQQGPSANGPNSAVPK